MAEVTTPAPFRFQTTWEDSAVEEVEWDSRFEDFHPWQRCTCGSTPPALRTRGKVYLAEALFNDNGFQLFPPAVLTYGRRRYVELTEELALRMLDSVGREAMYNRKPARLAAMQMLADVCAAMF